MIVEKRKRLREPYPIYRDWCVELELFEPIDWEEEPMIEVTPPSVLFAFALLTAISGFGIGSLLFSS
jgi:hypothetical protein